MVDESKTCAECRWALHQDFGYSNYTVEGTAFHCLKKLHPDAPFDEFYSRDKRLEFARKCSSYSRTVRARRSTSIEMRSRAATCPPTLRIRKSPLCYESGSSLRSDEPAQVRVTTT